MVPQVKITIAYMHALPGEPGQGEFEIGECRSMEDFRQRLERNQFIEATVRRETGDGFYERVKVLINRDDIAQIMEGWLS